MKSTSTINQAIWKKTECLKVEMQAPVIDLKVGVSLVSLRFVSLEASLTAH